MEMMTEICQYLRNWFNRKAGGGCLPKHIGFFKISGNDIARTDGEMTLTPGQYYRIIGSLFNDGVHKHRDGDEKLTDEIFNGAVWEMAIPPDVIALSKEIELWQERNGGYDNDAMSPFTSESFGGYSYSKPAAATSGSGGAAGWRGAYGDRLRTYKKI